MNQGQSNGFVLHLAPSLQPPIEIKKTLWVSTQGSARWSSSPFLWWEVLAGEDWTSEPAVSCPESAGDMGLLQGPAEEEG